ncbi:hypothetical protein PO909_029202 [Leuciscus waleckii]
MQETIPSHSQSQRSHSDDGSSLQDAPSSVVFSLQDTLKMALAKRNLDPPLPGPGQSNLLRRSVSQQEDFLMPSCPDFTDVVSSAFRSAPLSRPDRVARTLAAMAEAEEKGLGNMPPVEPCVSSLIVSPDEALRQNLRCPNPECRRTDDLLVRIYNAVSGLSRVGNSMAHLLLALHSALGANPPDGTASELLEASLQALGSIAFSSGKALGLTTQARAAHIPGHCNRVADSLSRSGPKPGDWCLHKAVVQSIWGLYGTAAVDLFASRETTHCPLWFTEQKEQGSLGQDALAHNWPDLLLYAFPPIPLLWPVLRRVQERQHRLILVAPCWPARPWFTIASSEGPTITNERGALAPLTEQIEPMCMAPGVEQELSQCSAEVRNTVMNARAPSTRRTYASKWKIFVSWCTDRSVNPVTCSISSVLEFLQHLLDTGRSPATLRVFVAALSAHRNPLGGISIGAEKLVAAFLKGAVRLNPPARIVHTQWDLQMVLNSLRLPPYEPLDQADIKSLSMKTAFLLAITSTRRVGELHALSVSPQCLRWGPEYNQATLWPNPAFRPKVLSDRFVNQPIQLAAFNQEASQTAVCPVRALRKYVLKTASWRTTDQLFVRFDACQRGSPLSKQRLSHWVVDTIIQAYESAGQTVPTSIKCHSTRSVATSWAALRGVPLSEICAAATWTSPCTFIRFYRINVAPIPLISSAVLADSI